MEGLIDHALKVKQLMHGLHMLGFINIQPLLAMMRIGIPRIEEEFILTLELLNATRVRRFLPLTESLGIPERVRREAEGTRRILYMGRNLQKSATLVTNQIMVGPETFFSETIRPVGGHIVAHMSRARIFLRKAAKESFRSPVFSLMRKNHASSLSSWVAEMAALKYASKTSSISQLPLLDFHEGKIFRASFPLKPFYEGGYLTFLTASKVAEEIHGKGEPLAEEGFRAITEKLQSPMGDAFKSIREHVSSPSSTETYNLIQREAKRLLFYDTYVRKMIYYSAASTKSIFTEELEKFLISLISRIQWDKKAILQHKFAESLLSQPAVPSLHEFNIQAFIRGFTLFSSSSRITYLNLAMKPFMRKLKTPLSVMSHVKRLIEIFDGEEYGRVSDVFSATKSYAGVMDRVLNLLKFGGMVSYEAAQGFPMNLSPSKTETLASQLTEYSGLMEKSAAFHSAFSGIKSIISNIFSSPLHEGWIKAVSGGLAAQFYSTSIKIPFEGFYKGGALFSQSLKLHEIAPVFQTLSASRFSTSETMRVQHPINVTIRVESLSDESDLRELERKIIKILREEARRYGLNI